jgi:hypothetical protein
MNPTTPRRLYKYLSEKYAASMLEKGNIRLGTLYEYRTSENEQVRDEGEGTFTTQQLLSDQTSENRVPSGLLAGEPYIDAEGTNPSAIYYAQIPNRNIYCTTMEGSAEVMKQFEAEACLEIMDVNKFFQEVLNELSRQKLFHGHAAIKECLYTGRTLDYNELYVESYSADHYLNTPADKLQAEKKAGVAHALGYWVKDPFYTPQKEMRTVYIPKDQNQEIKPIIINVPGIIPLLRRVVF